MKSQIVLTVSLPFTIKKGHKYYISCCPVLDVWSQGESEKKAENNLREAIQLFLIDCFERSTLDRVLKQCGFVAMKKPPKRKPSTSRNEMDIPLPFIIDRQLA